MPTINLDDLLIHLQPVVELKSGGIVFAEALLRQTFQEGDRFPLSLIKPLEDAGDYSNLHKISRQVVIPQACNAARRLEMPVSVNIAPGQLLIPAFVGDVADAIKHAGIAPSELIIEITERKARLRREHLAVIDELSANGHNLAIDDFGIGPQENNRMGVMNYDVLKTAGHLLEAKGRTLIAAGAGIAWRRVNIPVVIERVETQAELDWIAELSADLADVRFCVQGFALFRGMPLQSLLDIVHANKRE